MCLIQIFDKEIDEVVEHWWASSGGEAVEKKAEFLAKYPATDDRFEVTMELNTGPHATIHDACGY